MDTSLFVTEGELLEFPGIWQSDSGKIHDGVN